MTEDEKLMEQRIKTKRRKPSYIRQDAHKKPKLGTSWRRPKGLQSKMRLGKRGYNKMPEIGYGSPKKVRYMTRRALLPVNVRNPDELGLLDPAVNEIVVGNVGKRKKVEIIKKALEKNFRFMNVKNPKAFLENVESMIKKKKDLKEKRKAAKEKKKKELEKAAKEKEKKEKEKDTIEEAVSAEEEKEQDKKDLDRTLITKE